MDILRFAQYLAHAHPSECIANVKSGGRIKVTRSVFRDWHYKIYGEEPSRRCLRALGQFLPTLMEGEGYRLVLRVRGPSVLTYIFERA